MKYLLLAALLLSATSSAADYSETDLLYKSNDYYRSGDYAEKELVKRLNKKLDAEEMASPQSAADARFNEKLDKIYEDSRRELEAE
jgi:hypothetical protein